MRGRPRVHLGDQRLALVLPAADGGVPAEQRAVVRDRGLVAAFLRQRQPFGRRRPSRREAAEQQLDVGHPLQAPRDGRDRAAVARRRHAAAEGAPPLLDVAGVHRAACRPQQDLRVARALGELQCRHQPSVRARVIVGERAGQQARERHERPLGIAVHGRQRRDPVRDLDRPRVVPAQRGRLPGEPSHADGAPVERVGERGRPAGVIVGCGEQDGPSRPVAETGQPVGERALDRAHRRPGAARQLEDGQRDALRGVEHAVAVAEGHAAALEQHASVLTPEALDLEDAEPRQRSRGRRSLAHTKQQRDPLGLEPPRGEHERVGRRPVEPLQVVDDAQQRFLLLRLGEQAERTGGDQEAVADLAAVQPERRPDRGALDRRQPVREAEQGRGS
jgi:hypothetical protein